MPMARSSYKAASVLLLLLAVLAKSQAQWMQPMQPLPGMQPMQPMAPLPGMPPMGSMPEGAMVASASAVSNGPGSSSSFASNVNGVTTGSTRSTGSGNYATAATSGPNKQGCQVINQATSGGCNGGTNCCAITQKVERCNGYTTAVASVNGNAGHCCVALQRISNKSPQLFCAAPYASKSYLQMPANVQIELKPSCKNELSNVGSLACTVTFPKGLPQGFTYPGGFTSKNPLTLWANKPFNGFQPCNGGKFKRFLQAVSRTGPVSLTSKCE